MNKSKTTIELVGVSKYYNIFHNATDRLKQQIFRKQKYYKEFKALENVSFSVNQGENFGIIGVNGSGKSTLLQIIAGIIPHTKGSVIVNGKVAALLELGSGFDPEFTGRENIYINSSIFGLDEKTIEEKIDSIIDFADIGEFIDQPVKLYSSGMFVRLAFAITTSLDADILLVDEALAVGDIFFRQKCYGRLSELKDKGTSIILVSHAMNEVEQFCDRALLLDKGKVEFYGDAKTAVRKYYYIKQKEEKKQNYETPDFTISNEQKNISVINNNELFSPENDIRLIKENITKNGDAILLRVLLTDENNKPTMLFYQGQVAVFHTKYHILNDIEVPAVGVCIINDKNIIIHGKNTYQMNTEVPKRVKAGTIIWFSQSVKLDIAEGEYTFQVGFNQLDYNTYINRKNIDHNDFAEKIIYISDANNLGPFTVFKQKGYGITHLKHYGIADLPGNCTYSVIEEN